MPRLNRLRVVVAGAGAVGSATSFALAAEGAQVILVDPAPIGDNASGVAAGMLAPAFESVLDPVSAGHFELLRQARDRWAALPQALQRAGVAAERCGALWVSDPASQQRILAELGRRGAAAAAIGRDEAQTLSPGLVAPDGAVLSVEDWRVEPAAALAGLRAAFGELGGQLWSERLVGAEDGQAILADGERLMADAVVLATGMAPEGFSERLPEAALLQPIKGQIARTAAAAPLGGPVVRAEGVYVAPMAAGAVVGATMQAGLADRGVDPETIVALQARGAGLFPSLAKARVGGQAGVRAATPDGLPLAGPSRAPRMHLAAGARRNGWLLAFEIAAQVVAVLSGQDGRPEFEPARFSR